MPKEPRQIRAYTHDAPRTGKRAPTAKAASRPARLRGKARYVYLPAVNKRVPLGGYVAAVKHAIKHPEATYKHGLTCWWPCTGQEIRAQFWAGVQERINEGIPYYRREGL